jgi:hypothetical protein
MKTITTLHSIYQKKDKRNSTLQDLYKETNSNPKSFLFENPAKSLKNLIQRINILKRITPFLILIFCLPVLFVFGIIRNIQEVWLLFFLFMFIEANLITIDFALWNYHKGSRIWRMWLLEMSIIFFGLYFII